MTKHDLADLTISEALEDRYDRTDEKVFEGTTVPPKYRGTAADAYDMAIMGKKQVLRRNFSFKSMIAFSSTVMVAWEILLVVSSFTLIDGGTPLLFWGIIAGVLGMPLVYLSLAEMASMCPTAGGQYHWVSELAPVNIQKGLSYTVGWLIAMGWQVYLAGICFMVSGVLQGLIVLNDDTYVFQNWHGTLLTIAVVSFSVSFNTVLAAKLPWIEIIAIAVHFLGVFAIIIPLWLTSNRGTAHDVLLNFSNHGGWPSTGLAAMIGIVPQVGLFIGFDCAVHMSEETHDASRILPKSIMFSVFINAIMVLIVGITFAFCIGDLDEVLETPTFQPFIQVFFNATKSKPATNAMAAVVVTMLIISCVSEGATASRQLWSFARDKGLPASSFLSYVNPKLNVPVRAVAVSAMVTALLSLINLGSSAAFNAVNSLGVLSILFSYFITIGCLIWRRLYGAPLPPRRWSLGKWGLPINIFAILWLTPLMFFDAWPLHKDVTTENMNWSSVMFTGLCAIGGLFYAFKARFQYDGPVVLVKRDI